MGANQSDAAHRQWDQSSARLEVELGLMPSCSMIELGGNLLKVHLSRRDGP